MKLPRPVGWFFCTLSLALQLPAETPVPPEWALPGSATHRQVPPPAGFHRPSVTFATPLGVFEGQTDVGGPLLPGNASFDPASGRYRITSASYNIWYFRDEFRYLWKKMSGDVSLAADITFPNPQGYDDRKAVLIFRQDLDDNSKEVMVALHGAGLIHLAFRPEKGVDIKEATRLKGVIPAAGAAPLRLGIEKKGDTFTLLVSLAGEPMHPVGSTAELHLEGPFYVGLGFCSHLPVTADTTELANIVLVNAGGQVR